ncbi:MAG: UDP-N-acetylmuramoyl-L-alanyl-D-glutamate--2,6-diaminopimelate ligase [Synechococcales cyanobacterium RM1_1_8]|nr:UDP-N-acetylmuramoyl-L-alanyl-D-glutamate--2,6-diaminopimelate ligase [Synechococcales cyanobacterium RM1_1_8]
MQLRSLLTQVPGLTFDGAHPALDQPVAGLSANSKTVQAGELFIGMPGSRVDGGRFWPGALEQGAIAAVISPEAIASQPPQLDQSLLLITAPDMVLACAQLAAAFYDFPAQKMKLVGLTGTNGKTTTTHLVEFWLSQAQRKTAMLGTLYARWPGHNETAAHTTPFAADLQKTLAQAAAAGCDYTVMEVSSHALDQRRVLGCPFEVAVFTNLTQDHLDYHPTMADYFEAKALLFSDAYLQGRAVVNQDDAYGRQLIERLPPERVWSYSVETQADLYTSDLNYGAAGVEGKVHTPQGEAKFSLPLVGQFNLANFLGALGAGLHLGLDLAQMLDVLPQFTGVPGRMERVLAEVSPGTGPESSSKSSPEISVIVDYAHTPDSLENLLTAARPFIPGELICVFGCGGDRDRTKRPLMGGIAARLADRVYVTSDNPRTEDPEAILQDVVAGIPATVSPVVNGDRAAAIRQAILQAKPGDGVLIAGKGHEDYQILGTEKIHFDDREQARAALALRAQL